MKPSDSDDLSRALADWRVDPQPNPNFRPAVWERIRKRNRDTWAAYVQAHLLGWSAAAALAVVAATLTGHSLARAQIDAEREQMVVSYLSNLDPRVLANAARVIRRGVPSLVR